MIEQLFGSKTRVKLLQMFYSNPNRAFYVREITRKIDEQINSVRRELANLLSIGIIGSDTNNNRLYYEVDQSYEYYRPLAEIFGKQKPKSAKVSVPGPIHPSTASGSDDDITKALRAVGKVELAILTGQFTRDESSGVDLLIVGDINATQLANTINELETKEHKVINYAVMDSDQYAYRLQVKDRFIMTVLEAKKQVLIATDKFNPET